MSQNKSIIQRAKELLESRKEIQSAQYQENLEQLINELCASQLDMESKNTELLKLQEELSNEKERYSEFFNKSPLGYIIINKDFIVQDINATLCTLFEISPGHIKNKRIETFISPDSQDTFYLFLRKAFKTGEKETAVVTFLSPDKKKINTRIFSRPEKNNLKLAILDISEEQALAETIHKKDSIIEDIQSAGLLGIWSWYIEENRVEWNEDMFQLFGLDKESFSGDLNEVIQNAIHPEDRKLVEESNIRVIQKKQPEEIDYRVVWPDGSVHHIHVHAGRLELNDKGEASVLHGMAQDVCNIKKAEEALKASEKQYKFLAEKASDVVWLMDLKGQSLFVSPSVQRFTGFTEEEYLQQTIEERFTPKSAIIARKTLEQELITYAYMQKIPKDYSKTMELDYFCKDGNIKTGEILITPYFDEKNELIGLHGVTRDISKRAIIQNELEKSEKKYRELYENNPIGLYRTSINGEIVDGNQALAELLEYKNINDLKSRNVEDGYINIEDRRKFIDYFNENSVFNSISVWKTKSGKKLWVEERAIAIRDENNEIKFFDGSVIDITDRIIAEKQIQENLQSLKHSEDLASLGNFERNWQTGLGRWSDGFYRLLDLEPQEDEYTHEDFMKFIHSKDKERVANHIKTTIAEKKQMNIEFRLTSAQNITKYIHGIGINTYDDDGNILKTDGTFLDITERKKTEKEIINAKEIAIENETQLRTLFNTIPDLIWLKDVDGRYLKCNHRFEEFFGASETEIFGKTDYDYVEKDLADLFRYNDKLAMNVNKPSTNEEKIVFASDGHTEILETIKMPLRNQNNKIIGVLGIGRDITGRIIAEEALKTSESRYRKAQVIGKVGNWEYNLQTTYFWGSDEAKRIYGFEPDSENFTTEEVENCIPDRERVHQALIDLIEKEKPYDLEFEIITKDKGESRFIHAQAILEKDKNGNALKVTGVIHDITERKLAEQNLMQYQYYLSKAQEIGQLGSWDLDLLKNELIWTEQNYRNFDIEIGTPLTYEVFLNCVHPDDRDYVNKKWNDAINGGNYDIEHRILVNDEVRWLREKADITFDKNGIAIKAIGFTQDITTKKKAEIELKNRELLLNKIFDILPVGLWLADKNGKLFRSNEKGRKIWGAEPLVDPSEYGVFNARRLGEKQLLEPEDWALYKTITEGKTIENEVLEIEAFDNKKRIVLNYTAPVLNESNELEAAVIVNQDITDLKETEQKLIISEKRFRLMIENAPIPIFIQTNLKFAYLNRAALDLFGAKSEAEMKDKNVFTFFHPDYHKEIKGRIHTLNEKKKSIQQSYEQRYLKVDGTEIWVETSGEPIYFNGFNGAMVFARDISERMATKKTIEDKNKVLEKLNQYSTELSSAKSFEEVIILIVKQLEESSNAEALIFNRFDQKNMLLTPIKINCNNKILNAFEKLSGKSAFEIESPVNQEVYEVMLKNPIKHSHSLNQITMGAVPKVVSSTFSTLTGLKSFTAITFINEGVLVGTAFMAFKKNPAQSNDNFIVSYAHIASVTLGRVQTEELMVQSEEKYRLIAENTADTITIINLDFSFAYVSPSIKKLLGYTPEEYLKLGIKDIFPVESVKAVQKMLQEEMELEKSGNTDLKRSRTIEIQEFHKDGRLIWVESTASFIRDKNGHPVSILAISRDITQEKLIQEKLIESEEKFRLLAENSPFAIMIYQQDKWVYSNPAGENISGFTASDLYTMHFWDFVHPEDQQKVKTLGQARQRGENPESSYEFRIQTKNNEIKWVLLTGTSIQYRGAGAGLISIADITIKKIQETALRESDIRIRNYFNNAPYGIFIANKNGEYMQVNPMASIITGYSKDELLSMSIPDLIPEKNKNSAFQSFKQLQDSGHSVYEIEYLRKDGSIGWWSVSAVKLSDNEYLGFVEDITEKKEAENALIESRALFRNVANNSPVGIFRINADGQTTYVNPKYCEITDLSHEEAMGLEWTKAIHPEDFDYAMKSWEKAFSEKAISSSEYRFMHKDGKVIWVSGRAVPDFIDGEFIGYVGTVSDITERKNFELSILESEAKLKKAETVAGFGNWSFDLNRNMVETSEGARIIYGIEDKTYSIDEIQTIPLSKYRDALAKELTQLISGKKKYNIEFEIKRPTDGKIALIYSIAEYDKDANKVFGVIKDITQQKQIEQELLKREKHEKELVQIELEKTKNALIRSTRLAAVGQVSATIAHDLRNPLGAVRNAAFYLKRKSNQEEKTLKYFNIIDNEISTADRIISNMMQMTKMKEPQKEECMLEELIEYASGSHYKYLNIEIKTKILNGKGELFCDRVQIMQVFRNLLENADQSIETTTKVKIQYERKSNYTELIFSDNGPGISEDVKQTIFEPLITTKAKGTGLGLTICKQIIEKHGGHIELIDKKNAGACFKIELPNK